jgi:hypothetical protein
MSGTNPTALSAYNSPIDFRIGQTPPVINNFNDANFAISDIYAFAQQVIRTFVDIVGIGPQIKPKQLALAGSTTTLTTGNQSRFYVKATVNIGLSQAISLFRNGTDPTVSAKLAEADVTGAFCDGFCTQTGGIAAGDVGEVTLATGVVQINNLIVGSRYWLSATPGLIQNTKPSASVIQQYVGIAIDNSHLFFTTDGAINP